jgi:hypothetical protein
MRLTAILSERLSISLPPYETFDLFDLPQRHLWALNRADFLEIDEKIFSSRYQPAGELIHCAYAD